MILRYIYIAIIGLGLFLSQSGISTETTSTCEVAEKSCCHVDTKNCCGCDQHCTEAQSQEQDQFQNEISQLVSAKTPTEVRIETPFTALKTSNSPIAYQGPRPKLRRILMGSLVFYG